MINVGKYGGRKPATKIQQLQASHGHNYDHGMLRIQETLRNVAVLGATMCLGEGWKSGGSNLLEEFLWLE